MPFIPHNEDDVRAMLAAIGVGALDDLFDEIPRALRNGKLTRVPPALNEMQIARLMHERAARDGDWLNFIGAGAYEHHVPAAVWQIATRGEFYSAYTPYQAEASQGTLQLLYEYQSMMTSLIGMDVANASLYDGASALAEAVLMAVRVAKAGKRVLMPATVHPVYRKVVRTIVRDQGIELVEVPYCTECGHVIPAALDKIDTSDCAALVVPQPNFFGVLEPADELAAWARARPRSTTPHTPCTNCHLLAERLMAVLRFGVCLLLEGIPAAAMTDWRREGLTSITPARPMARTAPLIWVGSFGRWWSA